MVIANHLALVCLQTMPWLPAGLFSLWGRVLFPELPFLWFQSFRAACCPTCPMWLCSLTRGACLRQACPFRKAVEVSLSPLEGDKSTNECGLTKGDAPEADPFLPPPSFLISSPLSPPATPAPS